MNWIRAKDCNGLIEMEKGKLKRELISEIVKKLSFICYNMENRNWEAIDKLIEEYKEMLK